MTVCSLVTGTASLSIFIVTGCSDLILAIPIVLCGVPIIWEASKGLFIERDVTADVLVSVAMVAAVIIGEYIAAAEVALIMCLGELLEESTINHARSGIKQIVEMVPSEAEVVTSEGVSVRPLSEIRIGDTVRIKPGSNIPVDGTVVEGSSYIDRSLINGEPVPEAVNVGDEVSSGTVNTLGTIDVKVTAIGKDSTIGRIADLLENADAGKSRIARVADRAAVYIVAAAFTMAVLAFLFTGDVIRSVTVLVVFCPCALVLATPTAIMAATSNLSKTGILIKDGGSIERMAAVDTILMDKTGTITSGDVKMIGFETVSESVDRDDALRMVSSVEALSEHPLANAVTGFFDGKVATVTDFVPMPGYGVSGTVEGHRVSAGNPALMEYENVTGFDRTVAESEKYSEKGNTVVFAAIDGECVGFIVFSDTPKEGASEAVSELSSMGIRTIMLTGDNEKAARAVAAEIGVSDTVWECLPSTKLDVVRKLEGESKICMVGDGINDAPSLKRADVGISMGRSGKGMAIEAADIVFLEDDITRLPGLCRLSRKTLFTIKAGMTFSMSVNILGVLLAVTGLMGPIAGALVHNVGSLMVIGYAALLMKYDPWTKRQSRMTQPTAVPLHTM